MRNSQPARAGGVDSPLYRGGEVIDREEDGRHESTDAEAEEDYHNRLDERDECVDGIGHFAGVELRQRRENFPELAGLLSDLGHGDHDAGYLRVASEGV